MSRWRSLKLALRDASPRTRALRKTAGEDVSAPSRRGRGRRGTIPARRDVEIALLRRFQNVVVGVSLQTDLRGHAVEALRHSSERASAMSAIARAMRPLPSSNGWMVTNHRCAMPALSTGSMASLAVEPVEERRSCRVERARRGASSGRARARKARDDLHRAGLVVPPGANRDLLQAAVPCREECGMPAEQTFGGQAAGCSSRWRRA